MAHEINLPEIAQDMAADTGYSANLALIFAKSFANSVRRRVANGERVEIINFLSIQPKTLPEMNWKLPDGRTGTAPERPGVDVNVSGNFLHEIPEPGSLQAFEEPPIAL